MISPHNTCFQGCHTTSNKNISKSKAIGIHKKIVEPASLRSDSSKHLFWLKTLTTTKNLRIFKEGWIEKIRFNKAKQNCSPYLSPPHQKKKKKL